MRPAVNPQRRGSGAVQPRQSPRFAGGVVVPELDNPERAQETACGDKAGAAKRTSGGGTRIRAAKAPHDRVRYLGEIETSGCGASVRATRSHRRRIAA